MQDPDQFLSMVVVNKVCQVTDKDFSKHSQSQTPLEDFKNETKGWVYQEGTVTYIAESKDDDGKNLICSHVYYPLVKCNELPAPSNGYKSFAHKKHQIDEFKCMRTEH